MTDQSYLAAFSASDIVLFVRTVEVSEIKSFQKLLGSCCVSCLNDRVWSVQQVETSGVKEVWKVHVKWFGNKTQFFSVTLISTYYY